MSMAIILAHPNLSHAQALEVCRREGLLIVQTKHNNFRYESSAAPASPEPRRPSLRPAGAGAVAGPTGEAA